MTTKKTPGQTLVAELDSALPPGVEWTKIERTTLASIEVMADRLAALRKRCDAAIADPDMPGHQVVVLANATRLLEVSMHQLIKSLDPEMVVTAKSVQHRNAAMKRWHGAASYPRRRRGAARVSVGRRQGVPLTDGRNAAG